MCVCLYILKEEICSILMKLAVGKYNLFLIENLMIYFDSSSYSYINYENEDVYFA